MTNGDFIKKYGKREYNALYEYIQDQLALAKLNKEIGGYKINRKLGVVKFYLKDKTSTYLEFATIYSLKGHNIMRYIERKRENKNGN